MESTLVLSTEYQAIGRVPWQRAIRWVLQGRAVLVEEYDRLIKTISHHIKVPAVVQLVRHFIRKRAIKFTRTNVYERDRWRCQYCGKQLASKQATYDHVVPKHQKGETSWTNVVTCCLPCNLRKANRTPEQARMKLLKKPIKPRWLPSSHIFVARNGEEIPDVWKDYLWMEEQ